MATEEQIATITRLIEGADVALVTTVGSGGELLSRPLAVLQRPFDGDLWFFTADPSPKTEQVREESHVNVSLRNDRDFLSIAGTATVSRDQAMIDELWNRHAEAWFEGGKGDPAVALLRVHADSAEYWTVDSPKAVAAVKYAAAMVTGQQPDIGENETVRL